MGNEAQNGKSPARLKRVKRLKRLIVIVTLIIIFVPLALCIYFGSLSFALNKELVKAREELNYYLEIASEDSFAASIEANEEEPLAENKTDKASSLEKPKEEVTVDVDSLTLSDEELYVGFKKIYLTFDDGPSPNTDAILDVLKQYDVLATFFVVKREGRNYEKMYRRIVEEGHSLGMHSCTHVYRDLYSSESAFKDDTKEIRDFLYLVTGVESDIYRFPGGSSNHVSMTDMKILAKALLDEGIAFFDWNISSGDASSVGASKDTIVSNVIKHLEDSDTLIILFHDLDSKDTTVEALPDIIEYIQSMENTVILPITHDTSPIHHLSVQDIN